MLGLDELKTWLQAGISDAAPVGLNRLPDGPDSIVVAMPTGGSEQFLEGAFERQMVHIRSRAEDDSAAEVLAKAVHAFISGHESSFRMGETYVLSIEPMSPPSYYSRDVDNRSTYSATYRFTTPV